MDLYYFCKGDISYQDIESFCRITQTNLSIYEVGLIRKMSSWASAEEYKAHEEERDS
jgi:hypothetical protein